ncbi:MAG TPA: SRPBCC domain-containing protein [Solirubrobacterales bacterium]|nr:SRPBCC domain-containing protein [Solirubrobacterales bacterium]
MSYDSIEREVRIDAPVETVWSIVTEPRNITRWFANEAEVDLRPGGDLVFRFDSGIDGRGTVEKVEPPHLFAFRWVSPEPGRDMVAAQGHYTTVEFSLRAAGEGTLLRVVETGFAALEGTEAENAALAEKHIGGWDMFLERLAGLGAGADVTV